MNQERMKFPTDEARAVAQFLVSELKDSCDKIEVAGSLRRRKPEVSDIEIVFVPLFRVEERSDFFELVPINQAEEAVARLLNTGVIRKRLNVNGKEAWGLMNKLAVHIESGIPVDLFTANTQNFYNYLVCRTGPSDSNIRICEAARARGWKWNPYGNGFSRSPEHEGNERIRICNNERDVFEFVGMTYLEPWKR